MGADAVNNTSQPDVELTVKRNPVIAAYLTVIFAAPFSGDSGGYLFYMLATLLAFSIYAYFSTAPLKVSLLKKLRQQSPLAFYALLGFVFSSAVSYFFVLVGDATIHQKAVATMRYLMCWLLVFYTFMLARFCIFYRLSHKTILMMLVYGTWVLIVLLLASYFLHDAPNAASWGVDPPFGTHVRLMGTIASVAILCCVVLLWMDKSSWPYQCLLFVSLFVISGFLVWTGSRMSMLVTLMVTLLLALCCRVWLKIAWHRLLLVLLVMLLAAPVGDQLALYHWGGLQRIDKLSVAESDTESSGQFSDHLESSYIRMEVWASAINAVMESPVFGLGPHAYSFVDEDKLPFSHAHNIFLDFLVEWGFIGTLLLTLFLSCAVWHGLRNIRRNITEKQISAVMVSAVLLVLSLNALVDGVYFTALSSFLVATVFAGFPFYTHKVRPALINRQSVKEDAL